MLSQKEVEFLQSPENFSADYSYVLKYKIKNKVKALNEELELLCRAGLIEFSKITEFSKISQKSGKLEKSLLLQNSDDNVVGRTGFGPATFCTSSRCPNQARRPAHVCCCATVFGFRCIYGFLRTDT